MCTSFAVYSNQQAIYGMNFDTEDIDLKLRLNSYKDMNLFYLSGLLGNQYRDIAGFNSAGLFLCTQAVEYGLDIKSSCNENDWFAFEIFDNALKKSQNTSGFFEILNNKVISYPRNPLFPDLGLHTIIADKTGNAFILEEGNDINILSPIQDNFIIMTNFPNGDFKEIHYSKVYGRGAERYCCAYDYIQNHINSFGVNEAFNILSETSQMDTLCSIVYDPQRNEIYFSYKKDLSKKWKINVLEKTMVSLDGFLGNNEIPFTDGEILVNDLINLYK